MHIGPYRRIYYFHLKKCGGSTLNQWLDTLTADDRLQDPRWGAGSVLNGLEVAISPAAALWHKGSSHGAFQCSDVLHTHGPLRAFAPKDTFCFTMLRDPVRRIVSQVLDWRRLGPHDISRSPPNIRALVEDSRQLPLRDYLLRHGSETGRAFLDNYVTRALAAERIGRLVRAVPDAANLLDIAMATLENDYHFVGLTEEQDLSRNAICALLGLPPARAIEMVNRTGMDDRTRQEITDAADVLADLSGTDRVLYERACRLFERHRTTATTHDDAAFEHVHAGRLVEEMRGRLHKGATRFSVHGPLFGSGFHGRDGAGTDHCAVWTGPEPHTTLYFPTPADLRLSVVVWIRGYAAAALRQQVRVRINGQAVAHRFERESGYADVLVADAVSAGDFTRLDIEVGETVAYGTPDSEVYDPRRRGLAFDAYGWRPARR